MNTLVEELDHGLTQQGAQLHHREGSADSGWIVLDFGDVVIHLFSPEERVFYGLEHVWSQAIFLVRIQ